MGFELSWESVQVLLAFGCYLVGVALLGFFSHRFLTKGSFVNEYFLGNRGLGAWVLALTVAATAISGGTFMGFPSLIYTNGWIMALWICSYMITPLMAMAMFGKRLNQVARIAGAVTVPDVFRDRFRSPVLGVTATLLILLFVVFNLVAQFKAGGLVMKEAMRLRPSAAILEAERVEKGNLFLTFRLPDGRKEEVRTPLPHERATFVRAEEDGEAREVRVFFDRDGETLRKTLRFPSLKFTLFGLLGGVEVGYLIGLVVFAATVIAYTTYGGFWAVTWTDVLEGIVMLVGVVAMAFLAVAAVAPVQVGDIELTGLAAATERLRQIDPQLVSGPGPKNFLPLGMAFSFFCMWSLIATGQPSGMVRLMSFKDTPSLRRAILLVAGYYILTYMALLVIFVCARAILPTEYLREVGSEGEPDSIMPAMTRELTKKLQLGGITVGPFVAGALMAAPYAAIMSTVAAFLLLISSSLVRDLYQRTINPKASDRTLRRVSYATTALVGIVVMVGAINPPGFLQYIIVFTGTGQGCSFLVPMALSLYWKRATRQGMLAGMLGGFLVVLALYAAGWVDSRTQPAVRQYEATAAAPSELTLSSWVQTNLNWMPGWGEPRLDAFAPLYAGGVDPLIWGLLASLLLSVGVSLLTQPDPSLVAKFFPRDGVSSGPARPGPEQA
jgi:sodium/pantothenate symporter